MKHLIVGLMVLAVIIPTANVVTSFVIDAVLLSAAGFLVYNRLNK